MTSYLSVNLRWMDPNSICQINNLSSLILLWTLFCPMVLLLLSIKMAGSYSLVMKMRLETCSWFS
uniref:Uncharacterized protein n=1 Tax=Arundo donax TaxID=35708 RepID=A0A0A9FW95_ARUDO